MKKSAVQVVVAFLIAFVFIGVSNAQTPPPQQGSHPMMRMFHKRAMHRAEIIKKLNLTDEQKQKISDLRFSFRKNMVDLKADMQKSRLNLKELRAKGNLNREDVIAAVEKINKSRDKISIAVANHLLDVYQILTPDQQKIFKENHFEGGMRRGKGMNFRGGMGLGMMQDDNSLN